MKITKQKLLSWYFEVVQINNLSVEVAFICVPVHMCTFHPIGVVQGDRRRPTVPFTSVSYVNLCGSSKLGGCHLYISIYIYIRLKQTSEVKSSQAYSLSFLSSTIFSVRFRGLFIFKTENILHNYSMITKVKSSVMSKMGLPKNNMDPIQRNAFVNTIILDS